MIELLSIHPQRITFAESLAAVPMLGTIADHFAQAAKKDLREEGAEIASAKAALWASLDERGIREAIPVTPRGKGRYTGWDGRHRTEWALAKNQKTVPVRIVTEAEGRALLEASVVGRRHWTKGQLAWLAVGLYPQVAENTKGRSAKFHSVELTFETLAVRFGVSVSLIDQAVKIFRLFQTAPSLREKYEPGIWLGHGLGAVLAGIPGGETTADKPKVPLGFGSFAGPFATMNRLGKAFLSWTPDQKAACRDVWTAWLKNLPEDFRLTITEAVALSSDRED